MLVLRRPLLLFVSHAVALIRLQIDLAEAIVKRKSFVYSHLDLLRYRGPLNRASDHESALFCSLFPFSGWCHGPERAEG